MKIKMNLNKAKLSKAILASGLILAFGCKNESNGNGNGDATKVTLTITKPTGGNITSDVGDINCGSKGTTCEAEFDKVVEVTLIAKADAGYVLGAWQGACDKTDADQPCKLVMDTDMAAGLTLAIDPNDIDRDGEPNETDVDDDGDGLIEIEDLDMFNNIRHNLAGTSYKTAADAEDNRKGGPTKPTANCKTPTMDGSKEVYLCGYELTGNLDFAEGASYANGSINTNWRPNNPNPDSATNEGFVGIDSGFGIEEGFPSIFEGNGYTISNFYSRNTDDSSSGDGTDGNPIARVGLFKSTEANATIRNLGVVNARLYGSASDEEQIGSLVAKNKGKILACHATGAADGGDGVDTIGGLVGISTCCTRTTAGTIVGSYATVAVDGGNGEDDVGGLVGFNSKEGSIIASYATGVVNGGGDKDGVGGLVGVNAGSIIASYATGAVNDNSGDNNHVGGLVGRNDKPSHNILRITEGTILASFATGNVTGSPGSEDGVGGLVGKHQGYIYTSYATGNANGGAGNDDGVGGLAGRNIADKDSIQTYNSYATGDVDGGTGSGDFVGSLLGHTSSIDGHGDRTNVYNSYGFGGVSHGDNKERSTPHPDGLASISGKANKVNALTAPGSGNTSVYDDWNSPRLRSLNAWDFGNNSQPPALKYADYDGTGFSNDVDFCALFPDKIPGTDTDLECGTSLLPGQGR